MVQPRKWVPKHVLARRIARMLIVAHRSGAIHLGVISLSQCEDWQWHKFLTVPARMKLGSLWRTYGKDVLRGYEPEIDAGAREALEEALCA